MTAQVILERMMPARSRFLPFSTISAAARHSTMPASRNQRCRFQAVRRPETLEKLPMTVS